MKARKLEASEIEVKVKGPSFRSIVREETRQLLLGFGSGDTVEIVLDENEKKGNVNNRLKVAAKSLGFHITFHRVFDPTVIRFHLTAAE